MLLLSLLHFSCPSINRKYFSVNWKIAPNTSSVSAIIKLVVLPFLSRSYYFEAGHNVSVACFIVFSKGGKPAITDHTSG